MQSHRPSYRAFLALVALTGLAAVSSAATAANCTAMPVSGKTYTIVNEGSGLVLDVSGKDTKDGADIIQWPSNGQTNQQWALTDLGNGSWTIRPVHSNKALDLYGWSNRDGDPIRQWSYSGNSNQQWKLSKATSGGIEIASAHSKLLATIDGNKGTKLYQSADTNSSAYQRWYFNPVDGKCDSGNAVLGKSFMGGTKVLIGSGNAGTAQKFPFDVQYQYINNIAPVEACMTSCKAATSCGNWWGCWQWNERPPGSQYPGDFIDNLGKLTYQNQPHPQLTYWTYYSLRDLVGGAEGEAEINALNDAAKLKRYFADYRFFLQKIGSSRTVVHLEPDFWGFVRGSKINSDPHAIPAKVNEANPDDCPAQTHADTVAGFSRCLITMAGKYAPNAAVGLHASPWNYTATGDAAKVAAFMNALGAGEGDFVATDPSDRDAGWYETVKGEAWRWWDDQKFAAYLSWSKALAEAVGKPTIMWQIPLGNSWQNNTYQHYRDNRVELLFKNIDAVAAAHVVGLLFGPGDGPQTNIDTDYGMLTTKTTEYWKSGGATIK